MWAQLGPSSAGTRVGILSGRWRLAGGSPQLQAGCPGRVAVGGAGPASARPRAPSCTPCWRPPRSSPRGWLTHFPDALPLPLGLWILFGSWFCKFWPARPLHPPGSLSWAERGPGESRATASHPEPHKPSSSRCRVPGVPAASLPHTRGGWGWDHTGEGTDRQTDRQACHWARSGSLEFSVMMGEAWVWWQEPVHPHPLTRWAPRSSGRDGPWPSNPPAWRPVCFPRPLLPPFCPSCICPSLS